MMSIDHSDRPSSLRRFNNTRIARENEMGQRLRNLLLPLTELRLYRQRRLQARAHVPLPQVTPQQIAEIIQKNCTYLAQWPLEVLVAMCSAPIRGFAFPGEIISHEKEPVTTHGLLVVVRGMVGLMQAGVAVTSALVADAMGLDPAARDETHAPAIPETMIRAPAVLGEMQCLTDGINEQPVRAITITDYVIINISRIRSVINTTGTLSPAQLNATFCREVRLARKAVLRKHFQPTPQLMCFCWIFQEMTSNEVHRLIAEMTPEVAVPGQDIVAQGAAASSMYFMRRGTACVVVGGFTIPGVVLGPGKTFGEMGLLFRERRMASVRATTVCDLWVLSDRALHTSVARATVDKMIAGKATMIRTTMISSLSRAVLKPTVLSYPPFAELPPAGLDQLLAALQPRVYSTGKVLLSAGHVSDCIIFVHNGAASSVDAAVDRFEKGAVLGAHSIVRHRQFVTVAAIGVVDAFIVTVVDARRILKQHGVLERAVEFSESAIRLNALRRGLDERHVFEPKPTRPKTATVTSTAVVSGARAASPLSTHRPVEGAATTPPAFGRPSSSSPRSVSGPSPRRELRQREEIRRHPFTQPFVDLHTPPHVIAAARARAEVTLRYWREDVDAGPESFSLPDEPTVEQLQEEEDALQWAPEEPTEPSEETELDLPAPAVVVVAPTPQMAASMAPPAAAAEAPAPAFTVAVTPETPDVTLEKSTNSTATGRQHSIFRVGIDAFAAAVSQLPSSYHSVFTALTARSVRSKSMAALDAASRRFDEAAFTLRPPSAAVGSGPGSFFSSSSSSGGEGHHDAGGEKATQRRRSRPRTASNRTMLSSLGDSSSTLINVLCAPNLGMLAEMMAPLEAAANRPKSATAPTYTERPAYRPIQPHSYAAVLPLSMQPLTAHEANCAAAVARYRRGQAPLRAPLAGTAPAWLQARSRRLLSASFHDAGHLMSAARSAEHEHHDGARRRPTRDLSELAQDMINGLTVEEQALVAALAADDAGGIVVGLSDVDPLEEAWQEATNQQAQAAAASASATTSPATSRGQQTPATTKSTPSAALRGTPASRSSPAAQRTPRSGAAAAAAALTNSPAGLLPAAEQLNSKRESPKPKGASPSLFRPTPPSSPKATDSFNLLPPQQTPPPPPSLSPRSATGNTGGASGGVPTFNATAVGAAPDPAPVHRPQTPPRAPASSPMERRHIRPHTAAPRTAASGQPTPPPQRPPHRQHQQHYNRIIIRLNNVRPLSAHVATPPQARAATTL